MSLHHLAENLKKQGRGKDSELVHMTKGEVAGLHALARAHGGSLTTNPTTGLTEAGFLDTILSVGGGFLGGMFGGPLGAAVGSGLGSYLGGASPQQAMLSGLMGYGLSGLGEGLEKLGEPVLNTEASNALSQLPSTQELAAKNYLDATGDYTIPKDFITKPELYQQYYDAGANQWTQAATDATKNINPGDYLSRVSKGFDVAKNAPMDFIKNNL